MKIVVAILSLYAFLKTLYYGIYEYKQSNKVPGICIIVLSFVCLILPNVLVNLRIDLAG